MLQLTVSFELCNVVFMLKNSVIKHHKQTSKLINLATSPRRHKALIVLEQLPKICCAL